MVTKVAAEPKVLSWARKQSRLSIDTAAVALRCDRDLLTKIEAGEVMPNAGLFRRMADVYLLPEATLLGLDELPPDRPIPKDFRSFAGVPVELSYETIAAIRAVENHQRALMALAELDDEIVPPTIPLRSLKDSPDKLGEQFRKEMDFPVIQQLSATTESAFLRWRLILEKNGIAVYVKPLGNDTSRGVSLYDCPFPAIIVDQKEKYFGARSFTLFHEYAHLIVRQPGISNFDPQSTVEAFCNKFAAAVLMPGEAITAVFSFSKGTYEPSLSELTYAANKLCVTIRQVALRLEHLNFVSEGYYAKISVLLGTPKKKSAGGNEDTHKYAYLSKYGHYLPETVFAASDKGLVSTVEAARILSLAPKHFAPTRSIIYKRFAGEQLDEQ